MEVRFLQNPLRKKDYKEDAIMAKNYIYKQNTVTKMVIKGVYDADDGIVSNEDDDIKLLEKFKVFEGAPVEITVTVKTEEDLDE